MKKASTSPVRIKAEYNYYHGTLNVLPDGYLMSHPTYDSFKGRETSAPLEFESVKDAYERLTSSEEHEQDAMFCEHDGNAKFSVGGTYVTNHGQHSRPTYTIVSAKSGRCNKAIIAECEAIKSPTDH